MRTTWADNTFLDERNVTYFGEHMADGFIYAAVTLEYCPYLKKHFDGLRQAPKYPEDLAHNNIKLLQAWELLHLNLTLSLDDLIFPHPLKTLLISVHLFETLPHLYPQDKLYFKAGLSQSQTQYLTLGNANDFPLGYKAILYGDDHHESFSLKESFYDIQPKRKCTVGINYCAKFIRISQCILILSGDCQGYHKAANKVIELIGEPDIKFASSTHNIETELYEFKETQLSITSPYLMEANYRIQCTNEKCSSIEDVTNLPSREDYRPFTVARCIPLETTLACNDQGIGKLTLCTLAFDMVEIPTWIYFSHRQAGDFLVSISISITKSTKQQVLKVYVAEEEIKKDGRKENSKLFLEIPCQNRIMWNGIVQALQRFAVGDMEFWKDVVYTTTGMHLLIRLVHFSKPLTRKKICRDVDYAIKIFEKNCKVILPPFIHLDDQCMSANLIVPLQFSGTTSLKNFHFTMTSTDGAEIRQYVVIFVRYLSAHRFVVSK
ncbi:hypothetical protein QE152_g24573 [Popillia japonica]|uniref:Uncharacterized protein n=1 Tax=Popillia japonica TaxID=7064 RepID=A0AAW1K5C3_POPJA